MGMLDLLRDRAQLRRILDPTNPALVTGTPEEQIQARREWRRARDAQGIIAKWPEIPSSRLVFSRYWIEDTETGNLYREYGGDPNYAKSVCAYYVRSDGSPVMLEPADPPSRAEIDRRRAAKEQRQAEKEAAGRERRAQMIREFAGR